MIDHDLSDQLHTLAATVDEPFDLHALHRRISMQNRRRSAAKVGMAGAGVAAVVGGLIVVRDRPAPTDSEAVAAATLASQVETPSLPDCAVVLEDLQAAASSTPPEIIKANSSAETAFAGSAEGSGFKGIVTILTVDGSRITFSNDEPKIAPPTDGDATLDPMTEWVDGDVPLDAPPTLQVGEQVGLATTLAPDGTDQVIFVDISASAGEPDKIVPDDKAAAAAAATVPGTTIIVDGGVLPAGPTAKSPGTITAVGPTSIDVTLDEQAMNLTIDVAATPFYAGDTTCAPGVLTVGTSVGVAYHLEDGNPVSDAVLLLPTP